ncbi:hypothetical protein FB45DRAFT_925447 [Roridomyces roridus]|uniref:Nicotinamide-nucleotide adenylyltransferase n=1 Tax=Roridomyces roridus TaxID=1738132 RepID=A0AAD7FJ28_9AGAR|nr:hypothetical protein FB45DRAFT_925447 [Roridomyces roridus]
MSLRSSSAISLVQRGLSPFELVYVPHQSWPVPRLLSRPTHPLQISILDSSFNPPTLAHLALARGNGSSYDAKLYLLSVRNADKTIKPTDASYAQRLEMMLRLAQDSGDDHVAIGVIDEPTFVGKAGKLRAFLEQRLSDLGFSPSRPQLTFLLGLDTLERLLQPRYYGSEENMYASLHKFFSPEHDDVRVLCARRATSSATEAATLALAERFLSEQRIVLIDIGAVEQTYSSTAVRNALAQKDDDGWQSLVSPRVKEYIITEKLYT